MKRKGSGRLYGAACCQGEGEVVLSGVRAEVVGPRMLVGQHLFDLGLEHWGEGYVREVGKAARDVGDVEGAVAADGRNSGTAEVVVDGYDRSY